MVAATVAARRSSRALFEQSEVVAAKRFDRVVLGVDHAADGGQVDA